MARDVLFLAASRSISINDYMNAHERASRAASSSLKLRCKWDRTQTRGGNSDAPFWG